MRKLHEKIDNAEYYDTKIWNKEPVRRRWKFDTVRMNALIRDVKEGDAVIDMGAGIYGAVQFIAEHRKELAGKLVAIDQSREAKKFVDALNLPIDYRIGDVERVGFRDESFDVVIGGEIIEHMEVPENLVKEMARLCKKGGWMAISTVDTHCPEAIAHGDYPEHVFEFEPEDLIKMFEPYGETEYGLVGNYHFIWCKKR